VRPEQREESADRKLSHLSPGLPISGSLDQVLDERSWISTLP
jgi:hypothetical protein